MRHRSGRILVERCNACRHLYPGMPAALVKGQLWRGKIGIGERADGDANRFLVAFLRVEQGRSASRTKPEREHGTLVSDAHIFSGFAENAERRRKACQCCEDAAGPALACEAMANADRSWLAFDLNAQLSAGARRGARGRRTNLGHRCHPLQPHPFAGGALAPRASEAVAHVRHRHARSRAFPDTRASEVSLNFTSPHQHMSPKCPLRAGTQPFGARHNGQMAFGKGRIGLRSSYVAVGARRSGTFISGKVRIR